MKVMFATYPMAFHTPGGGEVQLRSYQSHLPDHGVDVRLFDPWAPQFLDHDLVHFFSCVGGSVHFCHFVKQLGLPLVISSSLWMTEETRHLYPADEIRAQLALADCVVANSEIECDTLARVLDLPREKFATVLNGVDDYFFQPVPSSEFRSAYGIEAPFVLNVGNIEPRKNQLRLVEAMKQLGNQKLVLIGHVRSEDYLEEVLRVGGEQVIHVGALAHDSALLRSAYAACDVFALPSTLETPGLAALEAAAAGARLVLTSEGACQEYFGDQAIYVHPDRVSDIAAGIRQAMEAPRSARHEHVRSWFSVTETLKSVYSNTIQIHQR